MSIHRTLVPVDAVLGRAPRVAAFAATSNKSYNDPFLAALLEMPTTNGHAGHKPAKMAVSMLIHAGILALLVILPVCFASNVLVLKHLQPTYVFTAPPLPPPPPAAAAAPQRAMQTMPKIAQPTPIVTPRVIPKQTAEVASNMAAPSISGGAGVDGGVPGGVPGGLLGGILGGTGAVPGPPQPAVAQGIVRVGGNVKAPELVQRVQPEYPAVARAARVEGTVVIDAVIDSSGNVVSEHALSGPNLLIPAALSAVQQWKYQPTYLDGKPVELAMQVTVSFNLG